MYDEAHPVLGVTLRGPSGSLRTQRPGGLAQKEVAVMAERPNLPSNGELRAAWNVLADAVEAMDKEAYRVFEAVNYDGDQEVTFEHVASVAVFGRDLQSFGAELSGLGEKLEHVALEDLEAIRLEGRMPHVPKFNKYGGEARLEEYVGA